MTSQSDFNFENRYKIIYVHITQVLLTINISIKLNITIFITILVLVNLFIIFFY